MSLDASGKPLAMDPWSQFVINLRNDELATEGECCGRGKAEAEHMTLDIFEVVSSNEKS